MTAGLTEPQRAGIDRAQRVLDASVEGWLPLPERRRVRLEVFGPWRAPYAAGGPDAGHLRRVELLCACAERTKPVWRLEYPGDPRPAARIALVQRTAHQGSRVEAPPPDGLDEDADALAGHVDRWRSWWALISVTDLHIQCADGDLDDDIFPAEQHDDDLDDQLTEVAACYALHYGATNTTARHAYWTWYLTEALPAAHLAVPDDWRPPTDRTT